MRKLPSGGVVHAYARTRVLVGFLVGFTAFAVLLRFVPVQVAILTGWNFMAAVIVVWASVVVFRCDSTATSTLSVREDDSRFAADLLLVVACLASLAAVGGALAQAGEEQGLARAGIIVDALAGVLLAWAVVHSVFTFRYAHLYYREHRGIEFNQAEDPDFRDFAYLALTVGMTYQVSDTNLSARAIRHTVTRHALLSFVFGTGIVAVTINVVAGLLR